MSDHTKIVPLNQMIQQFVSDGCLLYLEGILANRLPMAAIHEIIRAKRKKLHVVSAPNGLAIDQLIGAGCVSEVEFYFVGFMTEQGFATMRRFRDAIETGQIIAKESMGYAICMALRAGAYGIPFIPLPHFQGSDVLKVRKEYLVMNSPYNPNDTVVLVPALNPDVLLLHAHIADTKGNVFIDEPWPIFTSTTAQACNHVLVTVEEIVKEGSLDPSRITLPHFLVEAIAQVPYGAAPTALNHRYEVDQNHVALYQLAAETQEGFNQYLEEYILRYESHDELLSKIGKPPSWVKMQQKKSA